MSVTPIYSVTELRAAVKGVLLDHLAEAMTRWDYDPVSTWEQTPSIEALSTARFPAGAIASDGLAASPTRDSSGVWVTTWRIEVGIYDRGTSFDDTQARIGDWCAGIRTTLLNHRGLGGIAASLKPVSEAYDYIEDRNSARTLGAGSVVFEITCEVTTQPPPLDPANPGPVVLSTPTNVSVRPPR